jgi:hypothetical protein
MSAMPFPLDYSGEIVCDGVLMPGVENLQHEFIEKVKERLERARASFVARGDEISFKSNVRPSSLLHLDSALLSSVPEGKIILNSNEGTITYYLNFRKELVLLSLAIWGIFGSLLILGTSGSWALKIIIVALAWLFMMTASSLTGIHRFRQFVNRTLKEMNVREI